MENQRNISDCIILDDRWRQATFEMLIFEKDLDCQAERYGAYLVYLIGCEAVTVEELRAAVGWVNALDKEVVDLQRANINLSKEDVLEATARRIAHHAGRAALSQVKTARLKLINKIKTNKMHASFAGRPQGM